jgi:holo-[acyl-carrier protein] synthase
LAASLRLPASEVASPWARTRTGPRVGLDLISVAEVAASLHRFGSRYIRRVYTAGEARYCRAAAGAAASARFAARFAAKEAAVKALAPAHQWTRWRDIEVRRHRSGRCTLVLHGEAAALARRRGVGYLALSMTHDGGHAAAIVLAWRTVDAVSGR